MVKLLASLDIYLITFQIRGLCVEIQVNREAKNNIVSPGFTDDFVLQIALCEYPFQLKNLSY